jgi:mannose-6-phosphate isomerase-like protein (cupin superfamily)
MEKIVLSEKFAAFTESWRPKVVAELNGQEVKVVRLLGPFTWHHHEHEDELFLVWKGGFRMEFRDRSAVELRAGDCLVVPRGVEHRPVADEEAEVIVFEPAGVRNTGNLTDAALTAPGDVRL